MKGAKDMEQQFDTGIHNFHIRFATEHDTGTILELIKALAEYENMADQVKATEDLLRGSIFERRRADVLIAEHEGYPVGFALFFHNFSTFEGGECLYLEDLFVREEYRGRGFGKAIFRTLASIAVERGCPRFDWVCLDWNESSIAFYRSLGAVSLDDWTIYRLTGQPLHDLAGE